MTSRTLPILAAAQAAVLFLLGASFVVSAVDAQEDSAFPSNGSPLPDAQQVLGAAQGQVYFEKNVGQWHPEALFRVHANGYDAFITATGMTLVQTKAPTREDPHDPFADHNVSMEPVQAWGTKMTLVDSNPIPIVTTDAETEYHTNYFIGNDPLQWHTNVPTYHEVVLREVYPGIDLAYHAGPDGDMKYDFIVHPGANPNQIRQRFEGAELAKDPDGTLALKTDLGNIHHGLPITMQADGAPISNEYRVAEDTVSFQVGEYDAAQDLIIDPLVYSTFLGGSLHEGLDGIALDSSGNAYLAGGTVSSTYPTTFGAFDTSHNSNNDWDVIVTKLNSAGSGLVYSTFLGGGGYDQGFRIAVDASGNAYVIGNTDGGGFPTTAGAYDRTHNGGRDAFITKLNPSGSNLLYSTFLGGNIGDFGRGIALDSSGNVYATGGTFSVDYPTTVGAYDVTHGQLECCNGQDVFVTKLNAAGSALVYSTFIGSIGLDSGSGIAVDSGGNAYVSGIAEISYPTTTGAYDTTLNGNRDAFVTKLNAIGSALVYSTLLGGSSSEEGIEDIVLDSSDNAYVIGFTQAGDYPTTAGAYDTTYSGGDDAFVSKLNAAGTHLLYSTFLGGSSNDQGKGIALDSDGNVYATGYTYSVNFPTTNAAFDTTHNGTTDAFVTKINAAGSGLMYSTFLGGMTYEDGQAIALDSGGNAYVVGGTGSTDYPTTSGAYDTTQSSVEGRSDGFLTKIPLAQPPPSPPLGLIASCAAPHGIHLAWSAGDGQVPMGYAVYRSADGVSFTVVGFPTATSYTDTPYWRATAYMYRVTASNEGGESAPSSTVSLVACDSQSPSVTGNPSAPGWTNSATLSGVSWQDAYSGLQGSAEYSLGSASGATDLRAWTVMGTQPDAGQTSSWTPSWPLPTPSQGPQYVNVRINDRAGNPLTANGAYVLQYDTQLPSISGTPQATPWTKTIPALNGVTWQDSLSGLQATVQYSIGTSTGATNVLTWTTLPAQPSPGQTASWSPTWTPSTLAQGTNYVNVRVADQAGNLLTTDDAYTLQYDSGAPAVSGNPYTTPWSEAVPSVSGVTWQDALSGLQANVQYSVGSSSGTADLADWSLMPAQPTAEQTDPFTPTWTPTASFVQGLNYVNVRATDSLGNILDTPGAYVVRYDTEIPNVSGTPVVTEWRNTAGTLSGVSWQSNTGLENNAQYSIGSASGAADVLGWTAMPVQPAHGQTTPFNPTWSPSGTLQQGPNYVNTRMWDTAGGGFRETNGAYLLRFDTAAPTGASVTLEWGTSTVASGVTWSDPLSGLQATLQYSVGSTSGATNLLAWTNLPLQPTAGDASFSPTWTLANAQEGLNYVNVRVTDQAGNQDTSNGAILVRYDTANPVATGAPATTAWTNVNPLLTGVCFQDATSGFQSASTYIIGSAPGLGDLLASTLMPEQPSTGSTSWCPNFRVNAAALAQGSNYVTINLVDQSGNPLVTQAYQIRFDTQPETLSGMTVRSAPGGNLLVLGSWQNDNTPFYEWTSPASTSPIGYSLTQDGSDPDGTVVQGAANLDRSGAPLADGIRVLKVRAKDDAGNLGPVTSVTLHVDATAPTLTTLASPTHPAANTFYNETNATVTWSYTDSRSGVQGYYYKLTTEACPGSLTSTGTFLPTADTSAAFTGLGPFGAHRFCIQAVDNLGNSGAVVSRSINVDTVAPDITLMAPGFGSRTTTIQDEVRVDYSDFDGGLDPTQLSGVDVDSVQLFIDDVDIIAIWGPICTGAPLDLCRLEVLPDHVLFKPIVPFATGNHTLRLAIQDQVLQPNVANVSTYFIVDASNGATGDFDGDQVTDSYEFLICKLESTFFEADGTCNAAKTDWSPPRLPGLQEDAGLVVETVQEVIFP